MLTQKKIDQFYKDVEILGLKTPIATIAEKTGYSKGNVSTYLGKSKPPSEKFIDKFYESFNLVRQNSHTPPNNQGSNDNKYLLLLEENDRFFKTQYHNILVSLSKLIEIGKRSEELIKLNLEHTGTVEALQKGVDPDVVHEQINIQIAELGASEETGNDGRN